MTLLQEFKDLCKKHLVIYDDEYIDVIFGVIFANRLDSKPVWIYLVGPPGAGKTEIIQALDGDEIYALSSMTAKTLISGKIREKKTDPDPSLIQKLDGKILVIKDFTAMLKGNRQTLSIIFGQLRDAYDGTCRNVYGTEKDDLYKSKFGIIAAVTNAIDKHLHLLSALGERFLVYRIPEVSEKENRERSLAAMQNLNVVQREAEMKEAAEKVLSNDPEVHELQDKLKGEISEIATFVAKARTTVERDRQTHEIIYPPQPEIPTRLAKQLSDTARGLAMAREKKEVTADEIRLVSKIGVDSISGNRIKLIRVLLTRWPEKTTAQIVADEIMVSLPTAKRRLDDLLQVGIVTKELDKNEQNKTLSDNYDKPYLWKIKDKHGVLLSKWTNNGVHNNV